MDFVREGSHLESPWSLENQVVTQHEGVMDPFFEGHGDSRYNPRSKEKHAYIALTSNLLCRVGMLNSVGHSKAMFPQSGSHVRWVGFYSKGPLSWASVAKNGTWH